MEQGDFSAISHSCLLQRRYQRGGIGWRSTPTRKDAWPQSRRRNSCRRSQLWKCRSEEHTSELQSLMRISYAVFCLKKKKQKQTHLHTHAKKQQENIQLIAK